MIGWDEKKLYSTMMSRRRSPEGDVALEGELKPEISKKEDGEADPLHIAAQDIILAHGEKSAEKLKNAISNFIDLHLNSPQDESEE